MIYHVPTVVHRRDSTQRDAVHLTDSHQILTLTTNDITVEFAVPESWVIIDENLPGEVEAQSHESAYEGSTNFQHVRVRLDEPSAFIYGELPSEDRIYALVEGLKAVLPFTEGYDLTGEVLRFRWENYPAALFLAYQKGERISRYSQWVGLEIDSDTVLVMQFETTLPLEEPPRPAVLEQFTEIRASVTINGEKLDAGGVNLALSRVTDPFSLTGPVVASLKIRNGAEVRLAAPQNWFRRNMTENPDFPTTFFYEDDWRNIEEGESLQGALIQVSLISEARILTQLELSELPSELLPAYTDYLLANTYQEVKIGEWVAFTWGEVPARAVGVRYPVEYSGHAGGTVQQLILAEVEGGLMMLTIYAPDANREESFATWQTVLSSTVMNGEILPVEPLLAALEKVTIPE